MPVSRASYFERSAEKITLGPSSPFALFGNCMLSGILFASALGGDFIGVALILAAPTWGTVVMSVCIATIALLFTVLFGALLLKDFRNYQVAMTSLGSNTTVAAQSHDGDDDGICLECGQPMPNDGDACSACGWSYLRFEENH